MANGYWKLNGVKMNASTVRIYPIGGSKTVTHAVRQVLSDLHAGTQNRERVGKDLPRLGIEFRFTTKTGPGNTAKWDRARKLIDQLEELDVFTLEAPTGNFVFKNYFRAALSATNIPQADMEGLGQISVKFEAIVNGVWIVDGGDYCQDFSGSMTKTATGYEQRPITATNALSGIEIGQGIFGFGEVAGVASPLQITLPAQSAGYPLAVRVSDFASVQLTKIGNYSDVNEDGLTIFYEIFDLTGFLHPAAPSVVGDAAIFEICSSPGAGYISGGSTGGSGGASTTGVSGGIASNPVGSFTVGSG